MKPIYFAAIAIGVATHVNAEPTQTTLADYSFNFAEVGFEIAFSGTTRNYTDALTADDYITIRDKGYSMKTLIDNLPRRDRQGFIGFFNENCITGFSGTPCDIHAKGEVELDEDMQMIFRLSGVTITKSGKSWSTEQ